MLRKCIYALAGLSISAGFVACNTNSGDNYIDTTAYSAMVTSFSFTENEKVCPSLDSVFFSIDQANLTIFNADSLPVGTPINKLVPVLATAGSSSVEFIQPRAGKSDTTFVYTEDSNDSIDFSQGPVKLRILALDGVASSTYTITVNVHKVVPDTLVWTKLELAGLPTSLSKVDQQHSTRDANYFWCLTRSGSDYCIAKAENPAENWQYVTPTFNFTPNVNSLTGTDDALYILDTDGNLYTSTDGAAWSNTGRRYDYLIGAYAADLLGSIKENGKWYLIGYPSGIRNEAPADFPVLETSQAVTHMFEHALSAQMLITGGCRADGTYTSATWGYDGKNWARLSTLRGIKYAFKNMTLFPYFNVTTNKTSWQTTRESVIMAMNGQKADGTLNDTIYMTRDFGVSWFVADTVLIRPGVMPARTMSQAFIHNVSMTTKAKSQQFGRTGGHGGSLEWQIVLDQTYRLTPVASTLATTPITQWDCPYIYMFGGVDATGNTRNEVYRGVINYLKFKPLQ